MHLLDELLRSPTVERIYSDVASVQAMLDFKAALARAESRAGVIPSSAAHAIAANCRTELIDLSALAHAAASAGNSAIPLVKKLTACVARENLEAARYVHGGATSQDVIDTAGGLRHLADVASPLGIDTDRMRRNPDLTHSLVFAEPVSMFLSEKLGRQAVDGRVGVACRRAQAEKRNLRDTLVREKDLAAILSPAELNRLFDPLNYLGSAEPFIDIVLAANRFRREQTQVARG
jgi:adenylosuccinate lyase